MKAIPQWVINDEDRLRLGYIAKLQENENKRHKQLLELLYLGLIKRGQLIAANAPSNEVDEMDEEILLNEKEFQQLGKSN